jgi:2-iminoacetate synthase
MKFIPQSYKIPDEPMKPFIDIEEIEGFLKSVKPDKARVREVIAKSLNKNRLTLEETAVLINANEPQLIEEIKNGARELKKRIYGERIVLFAPLYVGNLCQNNCQYCGFKASNSDIIRKTLEKNELIKETEALEDDGHKRLILVFGEHPKYNPEFIADCVKTVYEVKKGPGEIRRVNINAAPLDIEGFKTVHNAGIGTYQIFQETYHEPSYTKYHLGGKKRDYEWRVTSLDRAFEAGIDDVGIGALFGLYDWRFEVMSLVRHVNHFEAVYNVGPHTISFPRIQYAAEMNIDPAYAVSDEDFIKLVAILRLAVPYTGMILTARESHQIRQNLMEFGVSQIDGGTKLEIGGYAEDEHDQNIKREQFTLNDDRSLNEIIHELLIDGFIPSFCTACYRQGRTGQHFMEFAVPGFVKNLCSPNAMLTLAEYLEDYAPEKTKKIGYELIEKKLKDMDPKRRAETKEKIEKIKAGVRDLYF